MYYNLRNIHKKEEPCCFGCSSNHGTFKKAAWQSGKECPPSYGTLKVSIAPQIPATNVVVLIESMFLTKNQF